MGRLARPGPRGRGRLETVDQALADRTRAGSRRLGVTTIPIDRVVGTVDRVDGSFDRRFRPSLAVSRDRWVRLAEASRRGAMFPPIDVYEVGGRYYVRDGHHRVSVARALGQLYIDADVTSIATQAVDRPADDAHRSRRGDRSAPAARRCPAAASRGPGHACGTAGGTEPPRSVSPSGLAAEEGQEARLLVGVGTGAGGRGGEK